MWFRVCQSQSSALPARVFWALCSHGNMKQKLLPNWLYHGEHYDIIRVEDVCVQMRVRWSDNAQARRMMSIQAKADVEVPLPHHADATAAISSSCPLWECARASEYM